MKRDGTRKASPARVDSNTNQRYSNSTICVKHNFARGAFDCALSNVQWGWLLLKDRQKNPKGGSRTAAEEVADVARWERIFARHVDPAYYDSGVRALCRSDIPSALGRSRHTERAYGWYGR